MSVAVGLRGVAALPPTPQCQSGAAPWSTWGGVRDAALSLNFGAAVTSIAFDESGDLTSQLLREGELTRVR